MIKSKYQGEIFSMGRKIEKTEKESNQTVRDFIGPNPHKIFHYYNGI